MRRVLMTAAAALLTAAGALGQLDSGQLDPVYQLDPLKGGAFQVLATGSNTTGATKELPRTSLFSLYDTRTSATDGAAMTIDIIQTSHDEAIRRTGLHCKSFTQPDNGGETSCILGVSTGGGTAGTFYKIPQIRPQDFADYSDSPQPAVEIGTAAKGNALLVISGMQAPKAANDDHSDAITIRIDNEASGGIVVEPGDLDYDDRYAFTVGNHQNNAEPVNVTSWWRLNGQTTFTGSTLSNTANDGTAAPLHFFKSRAGGSVATNEILGDLDWTFVNSAARDVVGALQRLTAADKTDGTEDVDYSIRLVAAGANAERLHLTSTGNLTVTGTLGGAKGSFGTTAVGAGVTALGSEANNTPGAADAAAVRVVNTDTAVAGRISEYQFGTSATGKFASVSGILNDGRSNTAGDIGLNVRRNPGDASLSNVVTVTQTGHVVATPTTPAVSCSGTGTSAPSPAISGSDVSFVVTINTGTASLSANGTCTVTFFVPYATAPPLVCMLVDGTGAWAGGATIHQTTESTAAPVLAWTNTAPLAAAKSYKFNCLAIGR